LAAGKTSLRKRSNQRFTVEVADNLVRDDRRVSRESEIADGWPRLPQKAFSDDNLVGSRAEIDYP
jgi:hypothetical protein